MKPRTVEDWKIALDAIEWFQQQLRAKSPDEVRAWIAPPAPVEPPQDVREIIDGLCREIRYLVKNWPKRTALVAKLNRAITALSTLSRQTSQPIRIEPTHEAADAFWKYWRENGETHKHGYYESTWGAINAALNSTGQLSRQSGRGDAWQPIETGPRDGRTVLLNRSSSTRVYTGEYVTAGASGWWRDTHGQQREPTHWQPLPASPTKSEVARDNE